jgi:hypothetical protein
MNESLNNNKSEGFDAELSEIVKTIQEREEELQQLKRDMQFPTAVKERLLNDINKEISALNKQKLETLAEKERVVSSETKGEVAEEIEPFAFEGKQRMGPKLS